MSIHYLDDPLISQIAAGEVIERPASVVKELMENSLDAEATSIRVEIEQGGLRYIGVSDDGWGIGASELRLALTRHATSKIDSLSALEAVPTLGFRGEALASIASVAGVRLSSRPPDARRGATIEASAPDAIRPAGLEPGTRCEVLDLFSRVPARRKFLKTPATEFRHVRRVFNQLALSRFDVGFRLIHDGRTRLSLAPASDGSAAKARAAEILGSAFMQYAVALDEYVDGMRLSGWLATPGLTRASRDLQYCFVNDRPVRDPLINHAVGEAYRDLLHSQRHPAFILYLDLDPASVDVNAHPAKSEIRFRSSRLVHEFVRRSVGRALAGSDNVVNDARTTDLPVTERSKLSGRVSGHSAVLKADASNQTGNSRPNGISASQSASDAYIAQYCFQMPAQPSGVAEESAIKARVTTSDDTLGHALGQLHDLFILAENDDGLVVVDMHAAHERIIYEKLKAEYSCGALASSRLLMPASIDLAPGTTELLEQHASTLASLGFEIMPSGPDEARITTVPRLLAEQDYLSLAQDLISQLTVDGVAGGAENVDRHVRDAVDGVLADMGCKAAIKAGRRLTLVEMNQLLRDMAHTHHAGHCNHGRPSWVQVDRTGLDRLFMRGR